MPDRPTCRPRPSRLRHDRRGPTAEREAEVEDVVRALRGYGVLTRKDLVEVCGATTWSDHGFRRALDRAVASGKIRRLSDDLYEIAEPTSPSTSA